MESYATTTTSSPARALVILMRGLSPAYIGAYGNEWIWTRTLDRLAARGVVFDQHLANHTQAAARPQWLDQLNQGGIRVLELAIDPRTSKSRQEVYAAMEAIPPDQPALMFLSSDALLPPWQIPDRWQSHYFDVANDDEQPLTPWLDQLPESVSDDAMAERLQMTYAGALSALDGALAKLLAGARRRGFGGESLIVVTADLALPLGEQDVVGWSPSGIMESQIHLPLILRLPDRRHAGLHINALTQPGDLGPTLLAHFGLPTSDLSLWTLIDQQPHEWRDHLLIDGQGQRAVRTADRLLIQEGEITRLYIKPEDRWEVNDLAMKNEHDVETLTALLNRGAR